MITFEERRLRSLAVQGRWPELLGLYRYTRAAAVARGGEPAAAEVAPLGHLVAYGAPPELAARLFDRDGGPGTAAGASDHDAGPLWEVLATRHTWRRLAPLLGPPAVRRLVAHTRVLLGEDLSCGAEPDPEGVPLALESWEVPGWEERGRIREYLPEGGARRALVALPATLEGLGPVELPPPGRRAAGLTATRLLGGLAPWLEVACVRGSVLDAVAQLVPGSWSPESNGRPVRPVDPPGWERLAPGVWDTGRRGVGFSAAERLPAGWPAREGGTGGRRVARSRVTGGHIPFCAAYPALVQAASGSPALGSADGRLALWRVLSAMTGETRLPLPGGAVAGVDVPEVNALIARLRCFTWCEPADEVWYVHLAVEDPATGLAWAVSGAEVDLPGPDFLVPDFPGQG
ncbi:MULTISPECIES: hypothetical protein [Kitasatospora]|uniref:Uncharacterized protein n=1 Tax=Kitasatospora cystarginea TaxID=58350 RepID=A0ABN3E2Q1_9ACTN